MSDFFDRVVGEQDFFKKILGKIPGFKGYFERGNRRDADKLLRESIALAFETLYARISTVQTQLISEGEISYIDDLESAAIKLRQFIDRVKTASYGYAGLFDAIKIKEDELDSVYQYDYALLMSEDEVSRAIDNVEQSIGTEGLSAAIRNLTSLAQGCVDAFNKRSEAMKGIGSGATAES